MARRAGLARRRAPIQVGRDVRAHNLAGERVRRPERVDDEAIWRARLNTDRK